MKNLIKLQLKKSFLSFAVLFGALLASVPLALAVKEKTMTPREAINLAMLYWAMAGIPLTALILSGIAGSEAAKEQARNIEQPLPVSQYKLLLSSVAAALLQLAALILAVCAILGFNLPLETLSKIQEEVLRLYLFAIVYLALYGFALSYAFRNGIAGAALAAAAVAFTLFPFITMSVFQMLAFELIPMWLIKPAIAALALAGGMLALKLLSAMNDRSAARTAAGLSAIALLLAAAPLASFSSLAWLNLMARKVTLPVTEVYASPFSANKYLYAARDMKEASRHLLVQKPFNGEAFYIDKDGNRSVLDEGRKSAGPGLGSLFPDLTFANAESVTSPSGDRWVLYLPHGGGERIMQGNMKDGFSFRAAIRNGWRMDLLGGKEPGVLERREDGYYYSPLAPRKDGLDWKKIASIKEGSLSFIRQKYFREGKAAVFRKDGKTLEYRGQSWTIPGAAGTRLPVPGIELADGMNFIVPSVTKDGETTTLCRPGGKAEVVWPRYFMLTLNLYITPDGAVWGIDRRTALTAGALKLKIVSPEFYILTADGKALSGISTARILERTGITNGDIRPLKAGGGYLWFNADNRYLVRAGAKDTDELKIWRLPKVPRVRGYFAREGSVSPSPDGIFITAADGVYFMDWEGKGKKIY